MWRSPRALVWRALAVVVALATTSIVVRDLRTLRARAGALGVLRPVVLARDDLPLGHRIGAGDVAVVERWTSQVPAGALARADAAVGRVVVLAVARGVPVVDRNVAAPGSPSAALVDGDQRIVRVPDVEQLQPAPGAVVDVVAAARDGATGGLASVVVSGAVVVASDDTAGGSSALGATGTVSGSDTPNRVTLLIRSGDLTRLASALAAGTIVLALAPAEDACCQARP